MKKIFTATDLLPHSERALRRAFLLAEAHGAALTVMHVVDEDLSAEAVATLEAEAKEELAGLCGTISGVKPEIRVVLGEPVAAIMAAAAETAPDLIVLGVHRPRPWRDIFSSTTMERIVRATECPVLLVCEAVVAPYRSVLCGIDLSPASAVAAQVAHQLAPDAAIETFHAIHVPYSGMVAPSGSAKAFAPFVEEAQKLLDDWWNKTDLPETVVKPVPVVGGVSTVFDARVASQKPDLVAVGAHGRAAIVPSLLGQFTERLIRTPPCDVVVVRR